VAPPRVAPDVSNPIRTVAVLPFVNNTNDVDGPMYVRTLFATELERHQYVVKSQAEVDQILKDQMSVTLGKQLDMTTPKQLGETLGVDGVIFGSLDDFNHLMTGVYNVKKVRVRTKLVNCKTGQTVWRNGIGVKSAMSTGNAGAAITAVSAVSDAKAAGDDLQPLLGDAIAAPWFELPPIVVGQDKGSDYGIAFAAALGERIATRAMKAPLPVESNAAVGILLNGTWHDGNWQHQPVRVGSGGIPAGPGGLGK
jgi:TolB-like protein